jgi:signal transducing adaptor molecule
LSLQRFSNRVGKEAEQEAAVFAQTMNIEKLLNMLPVRALDPAKDNLADDEEIQVRTIISCSLSFEMLPMIDLLGVLS